MDITLVFGTHNKTKKTFADNDAVVRWATDERKQWDQFDSNNNNPVKQIQNALDQIITQFQTAPDITLQPDETNLTAWLQRTNLYSHFQQISVLSESPEFQFIKKTQKDYPDAAPYLISYFKSGAIPAVNNESGLIAQRLVTEHLMTTRKATLAANRNALKKLHTDYQNRIKTLDGLLSNVESEAAAAFGKERDDLRRDADAYRKELTNRLNRDLKLAIQQTDELTIEQNDAIRRINETDRRYNNDLSLKPAYKYWSRKGVEHRKKAFRILLGLILSACVILVALGCALHRLLDSTATLGQFGETRTFLVLTVSVALTTILFWGARIATRIYLGNVHLANDAAERAILIHTYLALNVRDQATDADRALVLGTVFRPSTDGVVKDDAAPGLSPAGWLAGRGSS